VGRLHGAQALPICAAVCLRCRRGVYLQWFAGHMPMLPWWRVGGVTSSYMV
jgi:hypothetical protein